MCVCVCVGGCRCSKKRTDAQLPPGRTHLQGRRQAELRKQPHVAVVAELKALLAPHVELTDTKPVDLPNIITGDGPVRVYKERYADLLSVLAGDILNPRKKESIISTSRVIDNLAFEPRPNEHIELLVAPWM